MARKIVFVHGIGDHEPGYSDRWRDNLNPHLELPPHAYIEALWEPVMDTGRAMAGAIARAAAADERHPDPNAATLMDEIIEAIEARGEALAAEAEGVRRGAAATGAAAAGDVGMVGIFDWVLNPWEYLGDFVRYLLDNDLRGRVKAAVRDALLRGTEAGDDVSVISHSWGTVVSYEVAHGLAQEHADRRISTLFTFGCPLWIGPLRRRLEVSSGEKPASVDFWVNVGARGDRIGGWLHPTYAVDRDYQVPTPPRESPHGSYFAAGNETVLKDIVTHFVLQEQ